jgi:mono/diheme cytochrome c family protein
MHIRFRLLVLIPLVTAVAAVPATLSRGAPNAGGWSQPATSHIDPVPGKHLYREFCGQCHALDQALSAGFGSDDGLGQFGAPSFNNANVPYNLAIVAVTEEFGHRAHTVAVAQMTWQELSEIATFLAAATNDNPPLARITDS